MPTVEDIVRGIKEAACREVVPTSPDGRRHTGRRGPANPDHDKSNDMSDETITIRRADSSANEKLARFARHGPEAFGYKADLRIDRKFAQLLRPRVSQINNCTYCLNLL